MVDLGRPGKPPFLHLGVSLSGLGKATGGSLPDLDSAVLKCQARCCFSKSMCEAKICILTSACVITADSRLA